MTFLRFKINQARNWLASWDVVSVLLLAFVIFCLMFTVAWYGTIMYVLVKAAGYIGSLY